MAPVKKNQKPKKTVVEKRPRVTKTARSNLQISVGRILRQLRHGKYADHIQTTAAVYMASTIEYLSAEILEIAGEHSKANKKVRIQPRHIMKAIKEDAELSTLLNGVHIPYAGVLPYIHPALLPKQSKRRRNAVTEQVIETDKEETAELVEETDDFETTAAVDESSVQDNSDGDEVNEDEEDEMEF